QGCPEGQVFILLGEGDNPLAHAAAGAVDADDGLHTSLLLLCASRSMVLTTSAGIGLPKLASHKACSRVSPAGWFSTSRSTSMASTTKAQSRRARGSGKCARNPLARSWTSAVATIWFGFSTVQRLPWS